MIGRPVVARDLACKVFYVNVFRNLAYIGITTARAKTNSIQLIPKNNKIDTCSHLFIIMLVITALIAIDTSLFMYEVYK